jgi:enoyl-CoA hydratase
VSHLVPHGEALAKAREIAERICANGPLAVQAVLRSLRETESVPEADALKLELAIGQPIFATEDAREGPTAFAQKRKPTFQGR